MAEAEVDAPNVEEPPSKQESSLLLSLIHWLLLPVFLRVVLYFPNVCP